MENRAGQRVLTNHHEKHSNQTDNRQSMEGWPENRLTNDEQMGKSTAQPY